MKPANRLQHIKEYYFATKLREVRAMVAAGKPVINMGIGSPDGAPPQAAFKELQRTLFEPNAHQYQSYKGLPQLREAMAQYYATYFNVNLQPDSEIQPLMGSKEGITHISLAFLNPGDQVLVPNPGYPTYTSVSKLVGADPIFYTLEEANNYLPDFEALEKTDLTKVKLMWLNYPHMPTGALATKTVFKKLIAFAKTHDILVVNDNPYSHILNNEPLSILSIQGAKEVALELNSLSKSFNMAGWRVGMLSGSSEYINHVMKVKTQMDSGMFLPLQMGVVQALRTNHSWFTSLNNVYAERKQLLLKLVDLLNCEVVASKAGMFVWAKLPKGETSEAFIDHLLQKHHIFVAPGTIFGSQGEGFIRFSLCVTKEHIKESINRIKHQVVI
ncbi:MULTISPECIES: pyridoxal phosphate-dependent aminotransferase [Croceibacter]|uniref:pyridoxal phosphate-dependent aminotransferase n=1 Tax=Croceibacter TaxID=216431 RepID=UPI000C4A6B16|nr:MULTISPECIES: aminotransferase class I/II-fold pyridoxal phosphate-dependent enzyme [Croceibacter]MBG26580.1 aminotransferase [Croceibacter sp.]|tara:strand:- start:5598 stop:6755 length:1158 start_codon:yes stop_codon:yes gene_type:complete